jgi:protein required for attachment to host cells
MADSIIWALAMNSEHARILRGLQPDGSADAPELQMNTKHKDLQEIMSDKPGRVYSSSDGRISGVEYASDPVRDAQHRFVEAVVAKLDHHLQAGDFTKLAVFASPAMLGMVRQEMTPALARAVISESHKNLLHETPHDLLQIVAQTVFPSEAD